MSRPSPAAADRPCPWFLIGLLGLVLLAAPAWLGLDSLSTFFLRGDDFVYLSNARTLSQTLANLFTPHNAHVVPLFRIWTCLVANVAGSLAGLPGISLVASYAVLVVALQAVAHVVAWESRRLGWGFAAAIGVGLSSVLMPTVAWYSAGQALMAGAAVLAMLQALQFFRWNGRRVWVVLGTLAAAAAPWIWSGGYVAGLAGFVYLWLDGRPAARKAAFAPLIASFVVLGVSLVVAGRALFAGGGDGSFQLIAGAFHTGQAIPEILLAANLGLDAPTTTWQGLGLTLAIAIVWAWSRGWRLKPTPLEGAGAVMVFGGFGLAYAFRGSFPFDSLRGISWYQAIPELGAFLFLGGWAIAVAKLNELPGPPRRFTLRFAAGLMGLVGLLLLVQSPRATRQFLEQVPPLSTSESLTFPTHELRLLRGRFLAGERAARQYRFLARLDRLEARASTAKVGRIGLREAFGRTLGTGMPPQVQDVDAFRLLRLPESGTLTDPVQIRGALRELVLPEPIERPPWIPANESWAPNEW